MEKEKITQEKFNTRVDLTGADLQDARLSEELMKENQKRKDQKWAFTDNKIYLLSDSLQDVPEVHKQQFENYFSHGLRDDLLANDDSIETKWAVDQRLKRMKGYEFTQIYATRDIPEADVKEGETGGWIMTQELYRSQTNVSKCYWQKAKICENALSRSGSSWIDGDTLLVNSKVKDNAQVADGVIIDSTIENEAEIEGVEFCGCKISGKADVSCCRLSDCVIKDQSHVYNCELTSVQIEKAADVYDVISTRSRFSKKAKVYHSELTGVHVTDEAVLDCCTLRKEGTMETLFRIDQGNWTKNKTKDGQELGKTQNKKAKTQKTTLKPKIQRPKTKGEQER